jgi:hypothetical protein
LFTTGLCSEDAPGVDGAVGTDLAVLVEENDAVRNVNVRAIQ